MTPEERLSEDYSVLKEKYRELRAQSTQAIRRRDERIEMLHTEVKTLRAAKVAEKAALEEALLSARAALPAPEHTVEFWKNVAGDRKAKMGAMRMDLAQLRALFNEERLQARLAALQAAGAAMPTEAPSLLLAADNAAAWREAYERMRDGYEEAMSIANNLYKAMQKMQTPDKEPTPPSAESSSPAQP